jgi:hypothetical protein
MHNSRIEQQSVGAMPHDDIVFFTGGLGSVGKEVLRVRQDGHFILSQGFAFFCDLQLARSFRSAMLETLEGGLVVDGKRIVEGGGFDIVFEKESVEIERGHARAVHEVPVTIELIKFTPAGEIFVRGAPLTPDPEPFKAAIAAWCSAHLPVEPLAAPEAPETTPALEAAETSKPRPWPVANR